MSWFGNVPLGGVAERLNAPDLKSGMGPESHRGFESHLLRSQRNLRLAIPSFPWMRGVALWWICLLAGTHVHAASFSAPKKFLQVFVSVPAQQDIVRRIGGGHVHVATLVQTGQSPCHYEPTPAQVAKLMGAQAYFGLGVPFEKKLFPKLRLLAPNLRVVDTRQGERSTPPFDENHPSDPHVWLDPHLVMRQAQVIHHTLVGLDPSGRDVYGNGLKELMHDLAALNRQVAWALKSVRGKAFLVLHPAWGHFARAYGLQQFVVLAKSRAPRVKQLTQTIDQAKRHRACAIIVRAESERKMANGIAQSLKLPVVRIDPSLEGDNYVARFDTLAAKMWQALQQGQM